jgi:hypothetical protein
MTSIELKRLLIHRITEINDVSLLNSLKTMLDSGTEAKVISLTSEQRNEIIASKNEIDQGLFIDQSSLDQEFKKWETTR